MARIRTIKPEFPHSESIGAITRDSRLTFILLWTLADDSGRLRGNSRMLASLLFPYDNDACDKIDKWLGELEDKECIIRYVIENNIYIQINNWLKHQRIDKPSPSKIPEFREGSKIVREQSHTEGKGKERKGKEMDASREKVSLENLSVDHILDWLNEKKSAGIYTKHDPVFILDQFKQYCAANGKRYSDYIAAYRNAFEWEKCQPRAKEEKVAMKHKVQY